MKYIVKVNGKQYDVEIERVGAGQPNSFNQAAPIISQTPISSVQPQKQAPAPVQTQPSATPASGEKVSCPMPGSIFNILVTVGQQVKSGDVLLVLEAMKMENEIVSSVSGTVKQILVSKGASVNTGDVLLIIG